MKYRKRLANGRYPVLLGAPPLKPDNHFGLKVGDRILQIGSDGPKGGKNSSSARRYYFKESAIYSGIYKDEPDTFLSSGLEIDYCAFKIPEKYKGMPVFILFAICGDELLLQDFKTCGILIHKAKFTLDERTD